jgi:hypothetical protein
VVPSVLPASSGQAAAAAHPPSSDIKKGQWSIFKHAVYAAWPREANGMPFKMVASRSGAYSEHCAAVVDVALELHATSKQMGKDVVAAARDKLGAKFAT